MGTGSDTGFFMERPAPRRLSRRWRKQEGLPRGEPLSAEGERLGSRRGSFADELSWMPWETAEWELSGSSEPVEQPESELETGNSDPLFKCTGSW